MKRMLGATLLVAGLSGTFYNALAAGVDEHMLVRGRYLVMTTGCNDCHTPGYPQAAGKIPEAQWLTGSAVGFQGPWGTTYPSNLRLTMSTLSEQAWLQKARTPMRPPMPWFNLRDMQDEDLRAIYHYVRSLRPLADPAPAYVAPGQSVATPYIDFMPKNLPQTAHAAK